MTRDQLVMTTVDSSAHSTVANSNHLTGYTTTIPVRYTSGTTWQGPVPADVMKVVITGPNGEEYHFAAGQVVIADSDGNQLVVQIGPPTPGFPIPAPISAPLHPPLTGTRSQKKAQLMKRLKKSA